MVAGVDGGSYDPKLNTVVFGIGDTYDAGHLLEPHGHLGVPRRPYTDATLRSTRNRRS